MLIIFLINATSEGYEEVLDNVIGGMWDKLTVNPELSFGEIFNPTENFKAFLGGSLVGTVMGGGALVAGLQQIKTDTENIKQKETVLNSVNQDLPDEYQLEPLQNATIDQVNKYEENLKAQIAVLDSGFAKRQFPKVEINTNKVVNTQPTKIQEVIEPKTTSQSTETQKVSNVSPLIEKNQYRRKFDL